MPDAAVGDYDLGDPFDTQHQSQNARSGAVSSFVSGRSRFNDKTTFDGRTIQDTPGPGAYRHVAPKVQAPPAAPAAVHGALGAGGGGGVGFGSGSVDRARGTGAGVGTLGGAAYGGVGGGEVVSKMTRDRRFREFPKARSCWRSRSRVAR